MKKIIFLLVLTAVTVFASFPANALSLTEYGAPLVTDSFEKTDIDGFPYYNSNGATFVTEETAHSGKNSVILDWSALNDGDIATFARSFYGYGIDPTKENYGVEFYVKGDNLDINEISFYYRYNTIKFGAYTNLKKEAHPDGWVKVSAVLPVASDFNLAQSGYVGVSFTKKAGKTNYVYIDDLSVYAVPEKIKFKNRNIPNGGMFNLEEVQADTYNHCGTVEDLANSKFINWQVVSGNATIDGHNLIYNSDVGKIVLKGEFFGCTDDVTLYVTDNVKEVVGKAILTAGEVSNNNGIYAVTVSNSGDAPGTASIIAAIYKNGRLCDISVSSATVEPGSKVDLSTAKLTGDDIKVSVWDSIFGCISIEN